MVEVEVTARGLAAYRAGRRLDTILTAHSDAPVLLMLSGGSSLTILEEVSSLHFTDRLTITVLDERYTLNQLQSNFSLMQATPFGQHARERASRFIDPRRGEAEGLLENARRFEQALRAWVSAHPEGVIVATMGIGPDGHTAGLLPFPEDPEHFYRLFDDGTRWVVGYEVSPTRNEHTRRITTTLPFLRHHVKSALVYVVGEEKREALMRVYRDEGELAETPARIIREMEEVALVTDVPMQ